MLPRQPGPGCSKLTTSLVNDSLKFTSSDRQIFWNFLLKKMWVAFAVQKLLTFFQQKISEYCVLNPLKQLTKWPLTSSLANDASNNWAQTKRQITIILAFLL